MYDNYDRAILHICFPPILKKGGVGDASTIHGTTIRKVPGFLMDASFGLSLSQTLPTDDFALS